MIRRECDAWAAGYRAGLVGEASVCPPDIPDMLAFRLGWQAGQAEAARIRAKYRGAKGA
jgi:hypothetical protein